MAFRSTAGAACGIAAAFLLAPSPFGTPRPAAAQERYDPTARSNPGQRHNPLAPQGGAENDAPRVRPKFDPDAQYSGLPATEGADTVFTYCTYCHSAAIIMQQRVTPQRWDELITWMSERHGMPVLEPEDRRAILKYLGRHFSTEVGSHSGSHDRKE